MSLLCLFSDQTCEKNTSCVFSVSFPDLFYNLAICSDVFNIPAQEVYQRVAFENAYYGGDKPKGTKIVFVNGKDSITLTLKSMKTCRWPVPGSRSIECAGVWRARSGSEPLAFSSVPILESLEQPLTAVLRRSFGSYFLPEQRPGMLYFIVR